MKPYGPFRNDNPKSNIPAYPRQKEAEKLDHERFESEIRSYFLSREARRNVVKTTKTIRGQLVDWIPIESQNPERIIASPPYGDHVSRDIVAHRREHPAIPELESPECELGPEGTVPILKKKLDALGYAAPLRQYLSKYHGQPALNFRGMANLVPGPGSRGVHWYANSGQPTICFGGECQLSCFDPYTASSAEFTLIQIGLSNHDLGFTQSVEAGWEEYQDILGDWVPHLFVYYTTNGYAKDSDNQGGYNHDVDGWIQYDNVIFPGTTFTPYSEIGGAQYKIALKYQLYQDNWWLSCQGRWIGYYPAHLFMGNQSVFSTLGDHADHIGFWGEVAKFQPGPTKTDMGSGRFAGEGWTHAAYMHNLRVQVERGGGMADFDGSAELNSSDANLYDIDAHFKSDTDWGSYIYLGGPGAG